MIGSIEMDASHRDKWWFWLISEESKLSSAIASLSMDGLTVTEEEIKLARMCLRHEISYDDAVKYLVEKYSAGSC